MVNKYYLGIVGHITDAKSYKELNDGLQIGNVSYKGYRIYYKGVLVRGLTDIQRLNVVHMVQSRYKWMKERYERGILKELSSGN